MSGNGVFIAALPWSHYISSGEGCAYFGGEKAEECSDRMPAKASQTPRGSFEKQHTRVNLDIPLTVFLLSSS